MNNLTVDQKKVVNEFIIRCALQMFSKDRTAETVAENNYMHVEDYITLELFTILIQSKYNILITDSI